MGQYHVTLNLTKKEVLHPHKLGMGLKLRDQVSDPASMGDILMLLLACSNDRGGGDFPEEGSDAEIIGRWAGDRIAVVGDYVEDGDLPAGDEAGKLYTRASKEQDGWTDISDLILPTIERVFGVRISGEGWRNREETDGAKIAPRMTPDLVLQFPNPAPGS